MLNKIRYLPTPAVKKLSLLIPDVIRGDDFYLCWRQKRARIDNVDLLVVSNWTVAQSEHCRQMLKHHLVINLHSPVFNRIMHIIMPTYTIV